jgi:hypothetical protein
LQRVMWRRPLFNDDGGDGRFAHLNFSAQADYSSLGTERAGREPVYGYRIEWEGSNKGLCELKRGVKALAILTAKCDHQTALYGHPATFGAWVQRVCAAIGLDKVKFYDRDYPVSSSDAAWKIDRKIEDWKEKAKARMNPQPQENGSTKPITPEMVRKYIDAGGGKCPLCGDDDIVGGPVDIEGVALSRMFAAWHVPRNGLTSTPSRRSGTTPTMALNLFLPHRSPRIQALPSPSIRSLRSSPST